jgi:hypothetical protein
MFEVKDDGLAVQIVWKELNYPAASAKGRISRG